MGFGCHTQNSRDPSKKRLSSILKLGLICEIIFCLLTCYGDLDVMLQAVELDPSSKGLLPEVVSQNWVSSLNFLTNLI